MPMTLADILSRQSTQEVRIAHDPEGGFRLAKDDEEVLITATAKMGAMTPRDQAAVSSAKGNDISWLAPTLSRVLVGWDVTDDDGKPLPTTTEAFLDLPVELLAGILAAIGEQAAVPKANGKTSSVR